MRVLALDTTTRRGSVALAEDERLIDERPGDTSRSHAERLPGELLALLDAGGMTLDAVDLLAVASGPGSFTGIRIGIATVQGLSFVRGTPVVAVSTLDAVAQLAAADSPAGTLIGAWIDAQRGEVFSALYRTTDADSFSPGRLIQLDGPSAADPATTLARWRAIAEPASIHFAGDGAARYQQAIGPGAVVSNPPLLAGAVARIALARARRGEAVGAAAVHPEYVRRPDAEIDRDKRAAASS